MGRRKKSRKKVKKKNRAGFDIHFTYLLIPNPQLSLVLFTLREGFVDSKAKEKFSFEMEQFLFSFSKN